jgi:Gpi18-like mannosyltransferase
MAPVSSPEALISPSALSTYQSQGKLFNLFITPWYRWDTVHYLDLAENGYTSDSKTTVWPPLYPLLIKLIALITNSYLLSGIIVSNLAFLCALYLLYLLISTEYSEEVAQRSLLYLIIFPTAFFFVAPYSESLFLALSVGFFLAIKKQKWWVAGFLGICAVLTRLQGIFLVVPLIWIFFQNLINRKGISRKLNCRSLIPISVISAAFILYFLSIHFVLGREWPWMTLQSNWSQKLGLPWEGMISNIKILIGITPLISVSYISTFFDVLTLLGGIVLLIITRMQLKKEYLLYSITLLLLFSIKLNQNGFLVSTSRYVLSIFPLYISYALTLKKGGRIIWSAISLLSLIILLVIYYNWGWVA